MPPSLLAAKIIH